MKGLRIIDVNDEKIHTDTYDQHIFIDIETGVNYIMNRGDEVCCPRFNADGSLYITPRNELNKLLNDATNNGYGTRYI